MKFKDDPSTWTDDLGYLAHVLLAPFVIVIGVAVAIYGTSVKQGDRLYDLGQMLIVGGIGGANFSSERKSKEGRSSTNNPPDDYQGEV